MSVHIALKFKAIWICEELNDSRGLKEFSADAGLWLGNEEGRGLEPFRAADSPAGWQKARKRGNLSLCRSCKWLCASI